MADVSLWNAFEATWPPASSRTLSGWTIREGRGAGKRVSAATGSGDISIAAEAMRALGQVPLFALRGEDPLDSRLADAGYALVDPVTVFSGDVAELTRHAPKDLSVYEVWPPLAIMEEIWLDGGIGPTRVSVMHRVRNPKTGLLARVDSRAAGVGFVASHGVHAFVHALEVAPKARRRGAGIALMGQAAFWAERQGAEFLSVAVTEANLPGNALYASLGMQAVDKYHYRMGTEEEADG